MNGKLRKALKGAAAGAAGTTALNAVGYGDMALRGRPASSTPDQVAEQLARRSGLSIPGTGQARQSRLEGLGALAGMATGVAVGAAAGQVQLAPKAAARLIRNLQLPAGLVTLLHVGPAAEAPSVKLPEHTDWTWNIVAKCGETADTILETATEVSADLIVMTTDGPDGFLDGLRGTTSERVLRKARCPVASLSVGSMLG